MATAAAGAVLSDFFRVAGDTARFEVSGPLSVEPGYFLFEGILCYGRCSGATPVKRADGQPPVVQRPSCSADGRIQLPFDLGEVVTNLREERYARRSHHWLERLTSSGVLKRAYYLLRPLMPVGVRKHLQKVRLSGWNRIPFPRWPVDTSVDELMAACLRAVLEGGRTPSIPFIWFWPDGAQCGAMMTHDVEGPEGEEFCPELMDIDASFGVPAAFQVVPDAGDSQGGSVSELRARGFEVNVHDLNHDGSLFSDRQTFLAKAGLINQHGHALGANGFRSGAMYREQGWFDALDFAYDMSVPNVAHLEPQRGGCCTTFPYFVGDILELPLTTTQDYSLFHILGEYSTALWKRQIELIAGQHGLISFIAHPDYLNDPRALAVYEELLEYLVRLRAAGELWIAPPGEIDRWWRCRRAMKLVTGPEGIRIEGPGAERACVAYAVLRNGRLQYSMVPNGSTLAPVQSSGQERCR